MIDQRNYPVDFYFETKSLVIRWADGAAGSIPLATLRKQCPCSGCRAERDAVRTNPLHVLSTDPHRSDPLSVQEAALSGAYALRITWRDGHSTGIYNFELLRALFDRTLESSTSDKNVD